MDRLFTGRSYDEILQYCRDNPSYIVYRRDCISGYGVPKGILSWVSTRVIEAGDITECPLTKTEAIAYMQYLKPILKKSTINGLFKKGMLTQNKLAGYNGYVYLRAEIRAALEQLEAEK